MDWREVSLGDLVKIKHGWPFKGDLFSEDRAAGPIVVNIGNFEYTGGFRFSATKVRTYLGEYPKEYELAPRSILLVMTCQTEGGEILGIPAMIPDDGKIYLHNQRLGLVMPLSTEVDPDFLYWLFLAPKFNRELCNSASGTKILHTSPAKIEAFRFRLPPKRTQSKIAKTLWQLQNKIELNRKINESLEQMARAIFKSWFIDFDPVHAKRQGKKPFGMDDATADLFPDSFEQSELGEIPRGWQPKLLGEICRLEYGKNLPTKELHPSGVPVFGAGGIIGYYNDVLFRDPVILITCRGNGCGTIHETFSESFVTNNSIALIPFEKKMSRHFIKYAMLGIDRSVIITGSAQPQITVTHLQTLKLLLPDTPDLWSVFHSIIEPWWQLIRQNAKESDVLAATRDLLLPRLLSGELTLKEATA